MRCSCSAARRRAGWSDPAEQGLTGGLFNTTLQAGSGVGVAVLAAIASARTRAHATGAGLLPGYHAALWTAAAAGAAGLAIVLVCYRKPRPTPVPSTPPRRDQAGAGISAQAGRRGMGR